MSLLTDIKTEIKTILEALVSSGDLGEVVVDDFVTDFANKDIATYPAAILTTPSTESDFLTNKDNQRVYIFEVVIIEKGENIAGSNDIETLMDALLDKFDQDPTLSGKAITIEPATTSPAPVATGDRSFVIFSLMLRVRACKELTFV